MTNKELVKILREGPYLDIRPLLDAAADRLEALVKEKEQEYKDNIVRMAGQAKDFMEEISKLKARIEAQDDEIGRLRKANSDMGWRLNPDRMGGQFTEEEKSNTGWI